MKKKKKEPTTVPISSPSPSLRYPWFWTGDQSSLISTAPTCPCADSRKSGCRGADRHFRLLVLGCFSVLFTLVIMKNSARVEQIMGHGWRCKYISLTRAMFACSWASGKGDVKIPPELLIHCLRVVKGLYREANRASQEELCSLI